MADQEQQNEPVLEEVSVCTFENCAEKVLSSCKNCHLSYCLDHASEVDPANYCVNCLVPADAEVQIAPLISPDGTRKEGRLITPSGKAYRLSSKMVFEMTDEELKDFIEHEQKVVHDIESIREYHMITLGMAESEVYRRDIAACRKEGTMLKFGFETQYVPQISPTKYTRRQADKQPKTKVGKVDKTVELLKGLGLSPKDLVNLLNSLSKKTK